MNRYMNHAILGLAISTMGLATPATGQEPDPQARRELEERRGELRDRLRELERELAELERELGDQGRSVYRFNWGGTGPPRVVTLLGNRARLGIVVRTAQEDETDRVGAVVESVTPDGPAGEAGVEPGDIITAINGESLTGRYPAARPGESEPARKLIDLIRELDVGDTVAIDYRRDGERRSGTAVLRRLERHEFAFTGPRDEIRGELPDLPGPLRGYLALLPGVWLDMELVDLNPQLGRYFGTSEGLLVVRPPDDDSIGLQAGDVIISIDGRDPGSPSRALRILRSYDSGEQLSLELMRDGRRMTTEVTVPDRGGVRDHWDGGDWGVDFRW